MYGLEEQFGDQIDFIWLDIDNPATLAMREQFAIVQRSRYVLVDADGTIIYRWFGRLNQAALENDIAASLDG